MAFQGNKRGQATIARGGRRTEENTNGNSTRSNHSRNSEIELIQAIAARLETGLNEDALRAITDLLRAGVHPDAVVAAVTSLHQIAPH